MKDLTDTDLMSTEGSAKIIYILYLLSLIFGLTSVIGVVMAYINQDDAPDWLKTHYRFQIRTFWISLLLGAVGVILSFVLIGYLLLLFLVFWLIIRCIKGLKSLERREAHPDPTSWLF